MSVNIMRRVINVQVSHGAKLTLLVLADRADNDGKCWPSIAEIAFKACCSKSAIHRHLEELQTAKLITRKRGLNRVDYLVTPPEIDGQSTPTSEGLEISNRDFRKSQNETYESPKSIPSDTESEVANQNFEGPRSRLPKKRSIKNDQTKSPARGTVEEFRQYAMHLGLPASDGDHLFDHFESNGWMRGKSPVKDWRACMRIWARQNWLPSLKQAPHRQPQTMMDLTANQ